MLLEVSGRPVFALPGRLPVYRDLKPGATGDDVKQLQKALADLGHGTGSDKAGTFGAGTKTALAAFYKSIGYDPLPALADRGEALKAAEDAVTSAERSLEDARAAAKGGTGSTGARGARGAREVRAPRAARVPRARRVPGVPAAARAPVRTGPERWPAPRRT